MAKLFLLRHGKSLWNKQNRFTGWVDVPLAHEGWQEAKKAGDLLKDIAFDVAFTSHLARAIDTQSMIFRQNTASPVPICVHPDNQNISPFENHLGNKSEEFPVYKNITALAERKYGDLQGLNKEEVEKKFGTEQFLQWRRGYDTPPPNGESLKNTLERVLPYFEEFILPWIKQDKTILITAHGNSLRALTKFLEKLSDEEIVKLEIPTGTPIMYDLNAQDLQVFSKKIFVL
jgi:2,3-bisphosphoglycerate-dependent phosphoglycerate mutase